MKKNPYQNPISLGGLAEMLRQQDDSNQNQNNNGFQAVIPKKLYHIDINRKCNDEEGNEIIHVQVAPLNGPKRTGVTVTAWQRGKKGPVVRCPYTQFGNVDPGDITVSFTYLGGNSASVEPKSSSRRFASRRENSNGYKMAQGINGVWEISQSELNRFRKEQEIKKLVEKETLLMTEIDRLSKKHDRKKKGVVDILRTIKNGCDEIKRKQLLMSQVNFKINRHVREQYDKSLSEYARKISLLEIQRHQYLNCLRGVANPDFSVDIANSAPYLESLKERIKIWIDTHTTETMFPCSRCRNIECYGSLCETMKQGHLTLANGQLDHLHNRYLVSRITLEELKEEKKQIVRELEELKKKRESLKKTMEKMKEKKRRIADKHDEIADEIEEIRRKVQELRT